MSAVRPLARFATLQDLKVSITGTSLRKQITARKLLASLNPHDFQQLVVRSLAKDLDAVMRSSLEASIERTVSVEVERRFTELQKKFKGTVTAVRASDEIVEEEDLSLLDAGDFANRMGVSDQTVRNLESEGGLFSILAVGRKRGRQYPAFQLHANIFGEPLRAILAKLHDVGGAARFQFFTSPNDLLGGLTPIQVLIGHAAPQARPTTIQLLAMSSDERLGTVLNAAKTLRAVVEA